MDIIRVLVVDDHALMRDSIRVLLGFRQNIEIVGEASDGEEAVKKTAVLAPDVVIMDIEMPGMDGLEATRRIKKHRTDVKILILTKYASKEYILSAIKAGASGYLFKRALNTDLVSAIITVFNGGSFLYPSAASVLIDYYQHNRLENSGPYDLLTSQQREILKLIAEGYTCKDIGKKILLDTKTVYSIRSVIMGKLGCNNRTELIKYAVRKGLTNLGTNKIDHSSER